MTARFQFRLESLLRVRKGLEEEAKRRLTREILARDQAQAQINAFKAAQLATLEGRRTATNQVVDLDQWRATERFLLVLERRILESEQVLAHAEARVAEARRFLVKAHQDHLILARLKERRQEQHALEVLQDEIREMDEIAVLRYHFTHPEASNQ
jgi:flagellar protein FliJ